jgi:hypothetical protein
MPAGSSPMRPVLLVLAYVPILGLILVAAGGRDIEVRWHARNGQLLFAWVAAAGVAATLIGIAVPALSCLYAVAMVIVVFLYVSIAILATVKAIGGQRLMIPGISRHASRLAASS